MWISHARQPLRINQLRYALATPAEDDASFDPDDVLQARTVVDCCLGLVLIDYGGVVKFVHYTVQDYLQSERQSVFEEEECEIAKTCLKYLCLESAPLDGNGKEVGLNHHQLHVLTVPVSTICCRSLGTSCDPWLSRAD